MATNSLSSTIVLELLRNDNYANWCAWMKNYLLAQDLWYIVQSTTEPPKPEDDVVGFKAWRKNNAAALHAILISCEVDILPGIRKITSAKNVWDELARMYGPGAGRINNDLLDQFEPLRTAINNGNWDAANDFLSHNEDAKSATITDRGSTVLHVAVFAGNREIVENLVELLSEEELEIKDDEGFTALARAAVQQNNTGMLDCMLRKNNNLLDIRDNSNRIPLIAALEYGNIELARYLYPAPLNYNQRLSDIDASTVLTQFILLNDFDLALRFLQHCPRAAVVPNKYDSSPLAALASKSSAFPSRTPLSRLEKEIYDSISIPPAQFPNEIRIDIPNPREHQGDQLSIIKLGIKTYTNLLELKKLHQQALQLLPKMWSQVKQMNGDYVNGVILQAIKGGNFEFIDQILEVDHHLLYTTDTMGRNILFYAVLYRQAKIFRHILQKISKLDAKNSIMNARDKSSNTILHMAAMLESSTKSDRLKGKVLKIKCEFEWFKVISLDLIFLMCLHLYAFDCFKEVERICLPWIKEIRNDTKMTARELFTHNHKDMMKEGEIWMKGTATSSTVIGALIITIMFTAAITVPGGNNQNTGDIVQATPEPPKQYNDAVEFKAWTKNNAAALHAILISCEVDILPKIREITFAKIVWDKLASMYEPDNSTRIPGDSSSNISGESRETMGRFGLQNRPLE
ncbi:uncharacterized protein LOC132171636 [Corylus avellana]|uniref:uncharacterized protein LOC132171636 n=1 Tax=Corylus avellana TaxID=13451 RepID=UPI00286B5A30|nr:uncharacterized protein LOC132171636 [Corylus avellana]